MKLSTLLIPVLMVGCCDDFKGELFVDQPLTVKKSSVMSRETNVTIPPGQYEAELKVSRDHVELKIDGYRGVKFAMPAQKRNMLSDEPVQVIELPAAKIKQPYSLRATINTEVSHSPDLDAQGKCLKHKNRDYSVDIVDAKTQAVDATFVGTFKEVEKVANHRGSCD